MVTGAAGFIGSTLCEKLLETGHQILAVDCFTDYYDINLKKQNCEGFRNNSDCKFIEERLSWIEIAQAR